MSKQECRLAHDLHLQFGRVCSRQGGDAVCGECIADLDAPALRFCRKSDVVAAERGKAVGGCQVPEKSFRPSQRDPVASVGHSVGRGRLQ